MRIVIFGPPGAGKGTQGVRLADKLGLKHLATGDMLRSEVAAGSELGRQAAQFMDRGDLMPDEVIIGMIKSHLTGGQGMVLDGFPRTMAQARALDAELQASGLPLDGIVFFNVDRDELVSRLLSRASQQGRTDDNRDTINRRMDVYQEQTTPVLEYYSGTGKIVEIDGMGTPDEVFERLLKVVTG